MVVVVKGEYETIFARHPGGGGAQIETLEMLERSIKDLIRSSRHQQANAAFFQPSLFFHFVFDA
jgi:hypothetical protein